MSTVRFEISMSLDGYVTAAGVRPDEPMGDGGQQLHEWAFGDDERSHVVLGESQGTVGANIAGRRTYDTSIPWWGADGPGGALRTPTFIVSHRAPEDVPEGGVYTFATSPEEALTGAIAAAGDKDVDLQRRYRRPAAPRRPHQRDPYPLGARAVRRWNPLVRRHRRRTHRVGDHRRGGGFNGHPSAVRSRPAFLKPARSDCAATPF